MDWWVWIAAFAIAAAQVAVMFWLYRLVARWLLIPGKKPKHESEPGTIAYDAEELGIAVHALRVETSHAITGALTRLVERLHRR